MSSVADKETYLIDVIREMGKTWPDNRMVNIVCHGHSVPSGYFTTPVVNSLEAYPHLLFVALKQRFAHAVINVIVTAIGGENSEQGAARFESGRAVPQTRRGDDRLCVERSRYEAAACRGGLA